MSALLSHLLRFRFPIVVGQGLYVALALGLFPAACNNMQAQTTLSISGPTQIRMGGSGTYTALVNGSPVANAVWSVNGFAGGKAAYGLISGTGIYVPAPQIFAGHSVTIGVSTPSAPGAFASLSVKILNLLPVLNSGSATQTVPGTSFLLDLHGSNFLPGSQISIMGAAVAGTFVSSTELQSVLSLPPGTASVTVGVLNPNSAQKTPVTRLLPVQAVAPMPGLTVSPLSLAFGVVKLNTTATQPVTLASSGNVPLTITSAVLTGQGYKLSGATFPVNLDPGLALALDVQFSPAAAGAAPGQMAITSNSLTSPNVAIPLSGTGTPAIAVSIAPATALAAPLSSQQFTASVSGTSNSNVSWSVSGNGCSGINCGTISSSGLYTAPAQVPVPPTVTVTATSSADNTQLATATMTIQAPVGKTYYLAPSGAGGRDTNSGLTAATPWLTPNHPLHCGDVILAAPSTQYSAANFYTGHWGTVTCPAGNNVAWLQCATFDTCKILESTFDGMWVDQSYWGVQGWEVTTTTSTYGACFRAEPTFSSSVGVHHIIFANNVANGCMGGGFTASDISSRASVDYIAYVGNIAWNSAQGGLVCFSGLNLYQPIAADTLGGTHMYIAGNFSYSNRDPVTCGGTKPTDGEGIILDTFDFSQGAGPAYQQQALVENNVVLGNGGRGIEVNNNANGSQAPIYLRHNTAWGNNNAANQLYCLGNGEITIVYATQVRATGNLTATQSATGCPGDAIYALAVSQSDLTIVVDENYAYGVSGNNAFLYSSGSFSYGSNNVLGINPLFSDPAIPPAPSCGGSANVPACMAAVIANFTPAATAANAYGYQEPGLTSVYDPLFPQWLCNVNLPVGLVTMGCAAQP